MALATAGNPYVSAAMGAGNVGVQSQEGSAPVKGKHSQQGKVAYILNNLNFARVGAAIGAAVALLTAVFVQMKYGTFNPVLNPLSAAGKALWALAVVHPYATAGIVVTSLALTALAAKRSV